MKPTSLSPEFYENLYNEIIRDYDFDPDCEDAEETQCSTYIEVEDFQGFYICLKATYELNLIDDSFDHAFGTEYGWHMEIGELIDIEEVTMYDEDGNDVSKLFDYDAFFEQFKKREVKFMNGTVIKSGDTGPTSTSASLSDLTAIPAPSSAFSPTPRRTAETPKSHNESIF